jgi:hypothetical protein
MLMTTKLIGATGPAALLLSGAGLGAGMSAPGAIASGTTTTGTTSSVEDISGPCDEAEHRNDPRCAGAVAVPRRAKADDNDDNNRGAKSGKHRRGKGKGRSGSGGSGGSSGSDRSGSNSGRG